MRYGSLFAGIGGFDLGFDRAGMECAWQVEIDVKCSEILAHYWPDVERYGDVHDVGRRNLEPVDVVCGGFPCQDLSVAGRRVGLAGERSGLWWQFLRVIEELEPVWAVVENVPGLLSSNGGRDMGTLVGSLEECGYRWAYRVLDAQYFGVAQRRRRVFIVAGRGDRRPEEILFERESSPWDSAPSREAGKDVAGSIGMCSGSGGFRQDLDNAGAYIAGPLQTGHTPQGHGMAGVNDQAAFSGHIVPTTSHTLTAPNVSAPRHDGKRQDGSRRDRLPIIAFDRTQSSVSGDVAGTLRSNSAKSEGVNDGKADNQCVAFESRIARNDRGRPEPIVPPLKAQSGRTGKGDGAPLVAFTHSGYSNKPAWITDQRTDAIPAAGQHPSSHQGIGIIENFGVRRLTPTECERLQGFPDGWTAVNGMSDSARYKMLGNAMAVPVAEWIGNRIVAAGT